MLVLHSAGVFGKKKAKGGWGENMGAWSQSGGGVWPNYTEATVCKTVNNLLPSLSLSRWAVGVKLWLRLLWGVQFLTFCRGHTYTLKSVCWADSWGIHSLAGVAHTEDGSLEDLLALGLCAGHWTSGTRGGELGWVSTFRTFTDCSSVCLMQGL